jgi:ribose transport system substrate-binding protein
MKTAVLAAFMVGAVLATGCNKPAATSSTSGSKTIGVSIQNREAQFYQDMQNGMQAEASKYGYTLKVVDASRDNAKQQSQVEDFISQHVDAIVLTPYDSQAIGSAIVEANNAKIPVFTADIASTSNVGDVVSHIASDNVQGGEQAGKLICAGMGSDPGPVAIIDEPEVTSVQDRVRGFKEAIASGCPSAKIVADISGGGQRDKASSVMEDLLQSHKDLRAVFGINDDSALGAAKAVQAANLTGKIIIVGFDATPEARTAIQQGAMYGDAVQHPEDIGKLTIDAIHDYFGGKTPEKRIAVNVGQFTKADIK